MSETRPIGAANLPVLVSKHARDRAAYRDRPFWTSRGVAGIYAEVTEGLKAGRKAKTLPRWAAWGSQRLSAKRHRRGGAGTRLFVWNEEETRVYALVRGKTRNGPGWIVATTMVVKIEPGEAAEAIA